MSVLSSYARLACTLIAATVLCLLPLMADAGYNEWTPLGPYGGQVESIAISPSFDTDHTVFAGSLYGVYKSTDAGATWNQINDQPHIGTIVPSPDYANDKTLFAFEDNAYDLQKSMDGGVTWQRVNGYTYLTGFSTDVELSPDYAVDETVFLTTRDGFLFISNDGGDTWHSSQTGLPGADLFTVAISPDYSSDGTVFVGSGIGLYKSTDSGSTWFSSYSGMNSPWIVDIAVSPDFGTDQTVLAVTTSSIYRSVDGGASWSEVYNSPGYSETQTIEFSPDFAFDNTAFAFFPGTGVIMSTDGGQNWSVAYADSGLNCLAVSPYYGLDGTIFAGHESFNNYKGIVKTSDWGVTWNESNQGLNLLGLYALTPCPDPASSSTLFESDYYGVHKSVDGGVNWSSVYQTTRNVRHIAVSTSYSTDQTVFITDWDYNYAELYKSVDGGQNWSYANLTLQEGVTNPSGTDSIQSLALSPDYASDQTLFAGGWSGLYKSTDGGGTWSNLNSPGYGASIIGLSTNYSSDHTIIFGDFDGEVYKSTDGGQNWSLSFSDGQEADSLRGIVFSPEYATDNTVYLCLNNSSLGGLYKSTDGGATWNNAGSGLYGTNVKSIAISPDYQNDQTLLAVNVNVKRSTDAAATWHSFSKFSAGNPSIGSPNQQSIYFSAGYASDSTMYCTSSDQGAWVITYVQQGYPELTHYDWAPWLDGNDCMICHRPASTFLENGYTESESLCFTCHNASSNAHEKSILLRGHGVMANISSAGITYPTYGNVSSGEFDNRPKANMQDGNITCSTCHNAMQKTEDIGRVWEPTATSDNLTYTMRDGGWDASGYYEPRVYRDSVLWTGPSYVSDMKAYLVDPAEYSYDESAGTITFRQSQDPASYIYVTLYYPYLRASTEGNRLCSDCHPQQTHMGTNCLTCHKAHGALNLGYVRDSVRLANTSSAVTVFTNRTGHNSFADGDGTYDGVCEVCHTTTKYYRNDGSGFANHSGGFDYDGTDCTSCHTHASGFAK